MSELVMRPTALAIEGLGGTTEWANPNGGGDTTCMFCGFAIPSTEARYPYKPGSGFADWQYLSTSSRKLCAACVRFTENPIMTNTSHCVINRDGAWSLRKDEQLTWFFTTPPKPPLVAVWSTTQKAHLIWRASITTDINLLRVQVGRERLTIDRPLLQNALRWSQELVDLALAHGIKGLEDRHHPFSALDRKREDSAHGRLRDSVLTLAQSDNRAHELVSHLTDIGEGERWALAILAKKTPVEPKAQPLLFSL